MRDLNGRGAPAEEEVMVEEVEEEAACARGAEEELQPGEYLGELEAAPQAAGPVSEAGGYCNFWLAHRGFKQYTSDRVRKGCIRTAERHTCWKEFGNVSSTSDRWLKTTWRDAYHFLGCCSRY